MVQPPMSNTTNTDKEVAIKTSRSYMNVENIKSRFERAGVIESLTLS